MRFGLNPNGEYASRDYYSADFIVHPTSLNPLCPAVALADVDAQYDAVAATAGYGQPGVPSITRATYRRLYMHAVDPTTNRFAGNQGDVRVAAVLGALEDADPGTLQDAWNGYWLSTPGDFETSLGNGWTLKRRDDSGAGTDLLFRLGDGAQVTIASLTPLYDPQSVRAMPAWPFGKLWAGFPPA